MTNLSIVIPCYNEGENITLLFEKIEGLLKKDSNVEVIIVDNGSTDNTKNNISNSNLFLDKKIKIYEIEKNIGYGHGIMSGVKIASGEIIGWCHADLQTEPMDVYDAYLQNFTLQKNNRIIVKGLRKNRNLFDALFTFGMSILSSIVFQKIINDVNAQPKLFPKSFLQFLNDYPCDFSLDLYILVMAKIHDYEIISYKVIMKKRIYGEAKGGGNLKGKLKLMKRSFIYIFQLRKKIWKL